MKKTIFALIVISLFSGNAFAAYKATCSIPNQYRCCYVSQLHLSVWVRSLRGGLFGNPCKAIGAENSNSCDRNSLFYKSDGKRGSMDHCTLY